MSASDGTRNLRLAALPRNAPRPFSYTPGSAEQDTLRRALELAGLRKLRLEGMLEPEGRRDWRLEATLGATVIQPCVVTDAPVTTRIDVPVLRRYSTGYHAPSEGEAEMPEDDTVDPLPNTLDLLEVLQEALALELPAYPRAEGVPAAQAEAMPPGATPIEEAETKPFAGLKGLRDKLAGGPEGGSGDG